MNADDRAPAGGSQPPFTPSGADAGVRRPGILNAAAGQTAGHGPFAPVAQGSAGAGQPSFAPTGQQPSGQAAQASGQVPQRTAFRTGVQPTGAQPAGPGAAGQGAAGQGAAGPRPAGAAAPGAPGAAPTPAFAPSGAQPSSQPARAPQGGASPFPAGAAKGAVAKPATAGEVGRPKDTSATALGAPRKVRVLLSSVSPWSALKIGFLLSIAAGIMLVVAMHIIWSVLNEMGTLVMIQTWVSKLFGESTEVNILQFVDYTKVMSATLLVAVTNVVLISGLSIIGALLYNAVAKVVGGVYMTLTDD